MEDEPEDGDSSDKRKEAAEKEGADEAGTSAETDSSLKQGVRQPCILIFDSLAGTSKARTCQTLR